VAKHRRKYSSPFKAKVVQCMLKADHPVTQIAKEFEVDNGTLSN